MAPPFRKVEFDILFNHGINQTGELLDMGVDHGVLRRSGTWVSYKETRLGQGRERSREFLDENPEVREALRNEILEKLNPPPVPDESPDPAESAAAKPADVATSRNAGPAPAARGNGTRTRKVRS